MMAGGKTFFAPMPLRAMSDVRLSALDHRVLQCIAFHDRMSSARGKGQGAWASNRTMALKVGCDQTSLSSAITRLAKLDYITRERHHFDKRKHVYRVVYGDEKAFPDEKVSDDPDGHDGFSGEKVSADDAAADSFSDEHQSPKVVSHDFENSQSSQCDAEGKYIPLSGERYSVETGERNSSKDARLKSRGLGRDERGLADGAHLARFERALRKGSEGLDIPGWRSWIETIAENRLNEPEGFQALRLLETIDDLAVSGSIISESARLPGATTLAANADRGGGNDPLMEALRTAWGLLPTEKRITVASRQALSRDEVDRLLSGRLELPVAKLIALRAAAVKMAGGAYAGAA